MWACGTNSSNTMLSIAAPVLFFTVVTRRLSWCLNTTETALALGRTFSLTAETKSDAEIPLVWSCWTEKDVGSPSPSL